jgi:hypothetical protein
MSNFVTNVYRNSNGNEYAVLDYQRDRDIALLMRLNSPEQAYGKYVVCGGFKTLTTHGSWGTGHYYNDLESALTDFYDCYHPQTMVQTEDNTLACYAYHDKGCAKGITVCLNGEIVGHLEELEDSHEVRILTYAEGEDEPEFVIVKGGHE